METLSEANFKQNYQLHLQHLKLKGLQPKSIVGALPGSAHVRLHSRTRGHETAPYARQPRDAGEMHTMRRGATACAAQRQPARPHDGFLHPSFASQLQALDRLAARAAAVCAWPDGTDQGASADLAPLLPGVDGDRANAYSIRVAQCRAPGPGSSNKRFRSRQLRSHDLTLFVRHCDGLGEV